MNFQGKKLLIIGGAYQHCKLVEAAHKMGATVYVVDYLPVEKAPAKQIADKHYEYNITDIDEIVSMCKEEHIDGALASHLDACQIPYQQVCERMGFPCFGTKEQFHVLTDKNAFIKMCVESGADVIPQYKEEDFTYDNNAIEYPIFVKPCDSRGSRGQTVCDSYQSVKHAIEYAKSESKSGNVVIEKYMGGKQDLQIVYFVVDGNPYLIRLSDRYEGERNQGLDKLCIGTFAPSKFSNDYVKYVDNKVKHLIRKIGIKTAPVFIQGFIDGKAVRLYDPGLRCAGGEYETLLERLTGVSVASMLVEFALTGNVADYDKLKESPYLLNGKCAVQVDPTLSPGMITKIAGLDCIEKIEGVDSISSMSLDEGSIVEETVNVKRRLCVINMVAASENEVLNQIREIKNNLVVNNQDGNSMVCAMLDINNLKKEA